MFRTSLCGLFLLVQLALVACDSGGNSATPNDPGTNNSNGAYTLRTGTSSISVIEGGGAASVALSIDRDPGHTLPVSLAAEGLNAGDDDNLVWQFQDAQLSTNESGTALSIVLEIADAPLLAGQRQLRIVATDGANAPISTTLTLNVTPTDLPDIYLLAGQSNMVGFSEDDSKRSLPGQPDETNARVFQLNVTGNDGENFQTASDFTDDAEIAVLEPRFTPALDPLHNGFDTRINEKEGQRIGPGLMFAKEMLDSTTADIYLVPAAWSDTGFCARETNLIDGLGWLPSPSSNAALSGTLLHDRALARLNMTLNETTGIFRGILWHQGEGDSDDAPCAAVYESNLRAFADSIRTNAVEDARGARARGPNARIPFIVGTMSVALQPFSDEKQLVDTAHRNVAGNIPFADVVLTDDLIPPAYACGEGSCIHFGAAAYREMGVRFAEKMRAVMQR